jgi:NADP-dependent 3-hydroxy acid dehydrogenase YdfG
MKYAIITGASSGFGQAIAFELQNMGYGLVLFARRTDRLMALKAELTQTDVYTATLDVRDEQAVKAAIKIAIIKSVFFIVILFRCCLFCCHSIDKRIKYTPYAGCIGA